MKFGSHHPAVTLVLAWIMAGYVHAQTPSPTPEPVIPEEITTPADSQSLPTEPLKDSSSPSEPSLTPSDKKDESSLDLETDEDAVPEDMAAGEPESATTEPLPEEPQPFEEDALRPPQDQLVDPYIESRTTFQRVEMERTTRARQSVINNFGGVYGAFSEPLASPLAKAKGIRAGFLTIYPTIGVGILGENGSTNSNSGSDNGSSGNEPGVSGFGSFGLIMKLNQPAYDRGFSLSYNVTATGGGGSDNGGSTENPINQALSFSSYAIFSRLQLTFNVDYAGLNGTSRDIGHDANRQLLNITASAAYAISKKTSISTSLSVPIQQVEGGISSTGFACTTSINYGFSPKLTIGPAVTYGATMQDEGDLQTYQNIQAQIQYVASKKIGLNGSIGYQFRQIDGAFFSSPIFGLGLTWTPRLGTSVSIYGTKSIGTSGTEVNTNYDQTSISINLGQRITNRLQFSAGLSYSRATYESVGTDGQNGRVDNEYQGQIGLSYLLRPSWTISLSLSAGRVESNSDPQDFQQAIVQTGYSF